MDESLTKRAVLRALRGGLLPATDIARLASVPRWTVYRWAKEIDVEAGAAIAAWQAKLWLKAMRQAKGEAMSKVGGSWMLSGRPRSDEEAAKRGMKGRQLAPEEIAAEAARLGLPVAEPKPWERGQRRRKP